MSLAEILCFLFSQARRLNVKKKPSRFIRKSSFLFDLRLRTEKLDLRNLHFLSLVVSFAPDFMREHSVRSTDPPPTHTFFYSLSEYRCRPGVWGDVSHLRFICTGCLCWSPARTLRQIVALLKVSLSQARIQFYACQSNSDRSLTHHLLPASPFCRSTFFSFFALPVWSL